MASGSTSTNAIHSAEDGQEGITVAIRMRPLNKMEGQNERIWKVLPKYSSVTQTTRDGKPLSERVTGRTFFTFDKTFGEETNNRQVYDGVAKNIVTSVVDGLNGTIFAYGQTSSGKTFTMQGSGNLEQGTNSSDSTVGGIVHMAAKDIFSQIQREQDRMFLVRVSFLEIYNEEVRDLLSNDTTQTLQIREDPRRGVFVQSVEEIVTDFETLLGILIRGDKCRTFASTGMNERSSRSHTILRITIESREKEDFSETNEDDGGYSSGGDGAVRISTLNLVDLAGSESVRHTGATGERQKEGGLINQSLLTLSRVIVALGSPNQTHVNFRDSKLTRILQPSLSGNARMAVICCATPSELYLEETRSTLQFASRAKLVKTNAQVNEVLDERSMIRRLQRELAEAKRLQSGPGQDEYRDLAKQVEAVGSQAMEAKAKLDRLKASILNVGYLFEQPVDPDDRQITSSDSVLRKKRRKSDGSFLLHTSPAKVTTAESKHPTPKTAPRAKKAKTLVRPSLPASDELRMIRDALSGRNEFVRSLKATLESYAEQIHQKNLGIECMLEEKSAMANEMSGAKAELETLKNMVSALQRELEDSTKENEEALVEKESIILETFEKMQKYVAQKEQLDSNLADLQNKFDKLQEERIRSAFELAEMASEKENLLAERNADKTRLQDMVGKTEFLTSNLNEATREKEEMAVELEQLRAFLNIKLKENDELLADKSNAMASIEELSNTIAESRKARDDALAVNEEMATKISDLEENYSAATIENSRMKADIEKEREQKSVLETKLSIASETSQQLLQDLDTSEAKKAETESQLQIFQGKVEEFHKREEEFITQVDDLKKELNEAKAIQIETVQSHDRYIAAAEAALLEVKEELSCTRQENSQNVKVIAEIEAALTAFESCKRDLEVKVGELELQLRTHEEQFYTMESNLAAMKDEKDIVTAEKNSADQVLRYLKQQLTDTETQLATAEEQIVRLESEKELITEDNAAAFAELEGRYADAMENQAIIEEMKEGLMKDVGDFEALVSQRDHEKIELEMSLRRTQDELRAVRTHTDDLKVQLDESSKTIELLQKELSSKNDMFEILQAEIGTTRCDLEKLLAQSKEANSELKAEVGRLSVSLDDANEMIKTEEAAFELLYAQNTTVQQKLELCQTDLLQTKHDQELMKKALQIRIAQQIEMEEELAYRSDQVESLRAQIESLIVAKSSTEGAFVEMKLSMESLEVENEDIHNRLSVLVQEKNELDLILATVSAECENLKQSNVSSGSQIEELRSELELTLSQINGLEDRVQGVTKSRDALVKSLKECEMERDEAAAEVERLFESNRQLEAELANSIPRDKLEQMNNESSREKEEIIELKQLLASMNEAEERTRSALAEVTHEAQQKTAELKVTVHRLAELEEEVSRLNAMQDEQAGKDESYTGFMRRIEDLESENSRLEIALNEEKISRETREEELKQRMGEEQRVLLQEGEARMIELRAKIGTYEAKIAEVESEAYTARQRVEEITDETKVLENKYEQARSIMSQLDKTVEQQESQITSLKHDLEQQKTECYTLKESLIDIKEKLRRSSRDAEKEKRSSEMANSELEMFKRKYKSLEAQHEAKLVELVRLKKKLDDVTPESEDAIEHLKSIILNKETKIEQIESKISDLTRANEEAGKEITRLRLSENKSRPNLREDADLNREVLRVKEELKKKDERIKKLEKNRITKEALEKINKIKNQNSDFQKEVAELKRTISKMEADRSPAVAGHAELQIEISHLRFDNEALEKKLRKFATHCQRLEDDKATLIDSLRSCNIDLDNFNGDLNEAVIHLCDRLTSIDETRPNKNKNERLEDENDSLRKKINELVQSEDRLVEELNMAKKDISKLKGQVAEAAKATASHVDKDSKISYLEQENLQLMEDIKCKEIQVRAAHEEMESLRLRVSDQNSTMDFGSVDLRSSRGRDRDSTSSSSSFMFASKVQSEGTSDVDTMELMNMAVMGSSGGSGAVTSSMTKKQPSQKHKRGGGLSDVTNSASADSGVLPPTGKRQRSLRSSSEGISRKAMAKGDVKSRVSTNATRTPGLGESSTLENDEHTTECNQS